MRMDVPDPQIDRGSLRIPPTLDWRGGAAGKLYMLDQTRLPQEVVELACGTAEDVWEAIRALRVRGAPAIGIAGAYGLCLGTRAVSEQPVDEFRQRVREVSDYLCGCRPTAVNLAWAIARLRAVADEPEPGAARESAALWAAMLRKAHGLAVADAETCRRIGEAGCHLVPDGGGVLTHCNAGALATVAYGTALSLLYVAHGRGRRFRVFADETRPLLQGARLTAYELAAAGIDVTVLCDGAAAALLSSGQVQLVVVGADRIAANGDTANKIGTYGLALAARHHRVPFYVAAPRSTFDVQIASGAEIPIEQRAADEVAAIRGVAVAAPGVRCFNPAFDVTPAELVTGIVTEAGLVQPVSRAAIGALMNVP